MKCVYLMDKGMLPGGGNIVQCATMDERSEVMWNTEVKFGLQCETIEGMSKCDDKLDIDVLFLVHTSVLFEFSSRGFP